jgi:Domain of unknown function (DUF4331)
MRSARRLTILGTALVVLAIGAAPFVTSAADHLDAPSLGSLTAGSLQGDRDINDVYVFQGSNASKTAIAVTVSPAAGVLGPLTFGRTVRYSIQVDRNGDVRPDVTYRIRFGNPSSNGTQSVTLRRNGNEIAEGRTERTITFGHGGSKLFAGLRSDPFFFDLLGFRGSLGLGGNERLCDATPSDFFADLNTLAIVLQVPDSALGRQIGVWATTEQWIDGRWVARDQMGRPAINTVFNTSAADKEAFNVTPPHQQRTAMGGKFLANTIGVLQALSGLDMEGPYSADQASALANVLIPDVITYDTRTAALGPLNGRALADDVIDTELNITTGGDPLGLFANRDETGGVPSDCVGPHDDYRGTFPYLGKPH